MKHLMTSIAVMVLAPIAANSAPVIIYGNTHGVWSPTHPGPTLPALPRLPQPAYNAPPIAVHVPYVPEVTLPEVPEVCPTLLSQPHLC